MNIDLYGFLRALSFGGLVGSGLAILLYILFPQIFVGYISFQFMLVFGGLLGAAAHRGIDALIIRGMLYPFSRFTTFYGKLVQIELLKRRGIIDNRSYQRIKKEITTKYFLGESKETDDQKLLPPGK